MSRSWTEYHPRSDNIITADGFNDEYDRKKSTINGGIDRTILGYEAIVHSQIRPNTFLKVLVQSNIELDSTYQTSSGGVGRFRCLDYDHYAGGWVTNSTYTFTDLKEGMIHFEFSSWAWKYPYYTLSNPKHHEWRITLNGTTIVQTASIYLHYSDPFVVCDVPFAGGDATITVDWWYTAPETVDSASENEFMFGGANLLAIARWR